MESKLLNFNRIMSNFSTKLVGGFIPIIVYKYTTNMRLAILTLVIEYLLSFVFDLILRKPLTKNPQLFLFLRIIPIAIYEILLLFIEFNPILCVIGIGVAYSLSYTFKYIPTEVMFAYVNGKRKVGTGRQLAISKLLEQLSMILGSLLGGLALDYLNLKIMIIVSLILYLIGVLPIIITFFKTNTSEEFTTYTHIVVKKVSYDTKTANKVSKKISISYLLFYFLQESWQAVYVLMPLLAFTLTGLFTYSAIISAIFDGVFGVGCIVVGYINNRYDLTIASVVCGVLSGVTAVAMIFVTSNHYYVLFILCALFAGLYSVSYFFMYDRMLKKSKIVGRNTDCIIHKINMFFLTTSLCSVFGIIALPISFCVVGGLSIASGLSIPFVEEKTRKMLVDHLFDNDIKYKNYYFKKRS